MNEPMPCSITDGPQTPEDLSHLEPEDEDYLFDEWRQDQIDATIGPTGVKSMISKAGETQVGGDHYKATRIQPWDIIDDHGLDFYEGVETNTLDEPLGSQISLSSGAISSITLPSHEPLGTSKPETL